MEKMMGGGINMRKSIAMGEHERMSAAGKGKGGGYGKPKPKPTSGPPKGPKPLKMDGAAESYTERLY